MLAKGDAGEVPMKKQIAVAAALVVLAGTAVLAGPRLWRAWIGPPAGVCPICLRHEHSDAEVEFRAEGEPPAKACCLKCALTHERQSGKKVTILSVTDHATGRPLDPASAFFVVGSNVSPCTHPMPPGEVPQEVRWDRCLPSILAFPAQETADAFRVEHGGQVRRFEEIRREVLG
jgi:hypothetical protein